jgi:DNA-binding XRE family transcriptional regulator
MLYLLTKTDENGKAIENIQFEADKSQKWAVANKNLLGHFGNALLSEWDPNRKVWGDAQWWRIDQTRKKQKIKASWTPSYQPSEREMKFDNQPGMPGIQSVNKASTVSQNLTYGHMHEDRAMPDTAKCQYCGRSLTPNKDSNLPNHMPPTTRGSDQSRLCSGSGKPEQHMYIKGPARPKRRFGIFPVREDAPSTAKCSWCQRTMKLHDGKFPAHTSHDSGYGTPSQCPSSGKPATGKHVKENKAKPSTTLFKKLSRALEPLMCAKYRDDNTRIAVEEMIRIATSPRRFDNERQFSKFLTEGVLLNVNRLVSLNIGIPQGEYVVYSITPKKAMLIPTAEVTVQETDFSKSPKTFEVYTDKLLGCWNKIEGTITEDEDSGGSQQNAPPRRFGHKEIEQTSVSKYPDVPEVVSALEKAGKTQKEVASEIGVHPSTVSRYKRATSKKGGRVPSLGSALKLADATGADVEAMFHDIEPPTPRKATSGSGGGRNETYRQGNRG